MLRAGLIKTREKDDWFILMTHQLALGYFISRV